ncbi:39S ribosomal protein L28, mitochondrial [Chionoecetes opilio]|uniref:Large ribosomal subunit protein bL28m n=1 Tax=Chionoecetes opilio TaxID=41210 RepID=A0A8J5D196_CHIOP|nr:39S ribosomal protein L28, mitochondrial [Chionoecetes opilio]
MIDDLQSDPKQKSQEEHTVINPVIIDFYTRTGILYTIGSTMARRIPIQLAKDMILKPWTTVSVFQKNDYLSRTPEHYKKFYWEWKKVPQTPVHYIPTPGKFEEMPNGDIVQVQNVPIPLREPKQLHEGIWGGEAIIKGFQKRHPLRMRVPHYWVPSVKVSVLYSEILDRYMSITVTERTLRLIDQHYGFDSYLLETSPSNLMSKLALKLRREMLLALTRETLYPENPSKKKEILEKYNKFILPEEEADWFGLSLREALIKQRRLEKAANAPMPLKHKFRLEFVEYLKTMQEEDEKVAAVKEEGESVAVTDLEYDAQSDTERNDAGRVYYEENEPQIVMGSYMFEPEYEVDEQVLAEPEVQQEDLALLQNMDCSLTSKWLSRVNPFGKKQDD